MPSPERTIIGGTLEIPRMITGLWQLAGGHDKHVDYDEAVGAMDSLISSGLECFDMADHYGDAELIIGYHHKVSRQSKTAFTKWCPAGKGDQSFRRAEEAVDLALLRLNQKKISLLQYHAWDYTDDTYIHNIAHLNTLRKQGKIAHIGLTNTDAAHLELLLNSGFPIATNQVSCSVIDRRSVRGRLSTVCTQHDVKILAYGTLLGGFLSETWLDHPEPLDIETLNWSLRKYLRFIKAAGGWEPFQMVLRALDTVARRHHVGIAAVATRYVLDLPVVAAAIVGSRLTRAQEMYTTRNLSAFSIVLSEHDKLTISNAQESLLDIPGDCGDEYRRAPFLTASGDLSHHISDSPTSRAAEIQLAISEGARIEYSSGSKWEPLAGYCRALRSGDSIRVSGTTANSSINDLGVLGGTSARSQTLAVLDIIARALKALGGELKDVVRTRVMVRREEDCEEVSLAHGWAFGCLGVRPVNTMIVAELIGKEFLVEIEAEAELGLKGVLKV